MALSYGFYDSYNGDRKYNTEQISSMFDGLITDGVFQAIDEKLMVVPGDGLQVIIKSGKAWFDNTWLVNDSWYPLNLPESDVSRPRIDAIVIETNHNENVRRTSIKVVSGTPSFDPVKPTLTNDSLVHQHPLAYVTVPASTTVINSTNIEVRVGFSDCPFITGLLRSTSIDDLFNSWNEQFKAFQNSKEQDYQKFLANAQKEVTDWIAQQQGAFMSWWDEVKSTLDTDTAAKLTQSTIDNREAIAKEVQDRIDGDNALSARADNLGATKQNKIDLQGILKGTGDGGVTTAVAGADFAEANVGEWRIRLYIDSGYFDAPSTLVNPVHVMCFGGGGAGSYLYYASSVSQYVTYCGNVACGGSGRFTEKDLNLNPSQRYTVNIGAGGTITVPSPSNEYANQYTHGSKGGETNFGNGLVVASGGNPASYKNGGDGGAGGAGGDCRYILSNYSSLGYNGGNGGRGYEFGGGGGGGSMIGTLSGDTSTTYRKGGNGGAGGTYGGGGGGGMGRIADPNGGSTARSREQDVGRPGPKGTYGGYGGGRSSSSSTSMLEATDGATSMPHSKWYLMLSQQYAQIFDTADHGTSINNNPANFYASGGGGGFHSNGSPAEIVNAGSPAQRATACGGGGGGYGMPTGTMCPGRSGRGYGGFGFFDDFLTLSKSDRPFPMNTWTSALGASAGGAGGWGSKNGYGAYLNGGGAGNTMNGKSGLCIIFYRVKE